MTPREAAVAREIVRLAREELRIPGAAVELRPGEALASSLDSLALLALVVAVEDRFRVVLTDDDADTRTLEDLARLVAARTEVVLDAAGGGADAAASGRP